MTLAPFALLPLSALALVLGALAVRAMREARAELAPLLAAVVRPPRPVPGVAPFEVTDGPLGPGRRPLPDPAPPPIAKKPPDEDAARAAFPEGSVIFRDALRLRTAIAKLDGVKVDAADEPPAARFERPTSAPRARQATAPDDDDDRDLDRLLAAALEDDEP